jgi:hypothetical protein
VHVICDNLVFIPPDADMEEAVRNLERMLAPEKDT